MKDFEINLDFHDMRELPLCFIRQYAGFDKKANIEIIDSFL